MIRWIVYYLILVNIITFFTYGIDKWKARRDKWRVPERTLLLMAAAGGSAGALAAMTMFHHKTRKIRFYVGVPLILAVQAVLFWLGYTRL